MSIVQYFKVTSPDGVTLRTANKYCRHNLLIKPNLAPLSVNKNGTYTVPGGYAGHGQVNVNVPGKTESKLSVNKNGSYTPPEGTVYSAVEVAVPIKEEITLVVTKNGTYTAPEGKVFTSIVVNIPQTEQGGTETPPETPPATNSFSIHIRDEFSITYEGSSPTVECPGCLDYYIDGGIIVFTGVAIGSGTIYLRDSDTLIGQYTVEVTEAVHVHKYASTVVSPTCTKGGYTIQTCACGDSVTGSYTAALGHAWSAPYYGDEFSSGYGRKCTRCGELEELSEPECGHAWEFIRRVDPTCETQGYDLFACSLCDTTDKDNFVPALGHKWGTPYYSEVFSSGYGHKCTACGELEELAEPDSGDHTHVYTSVVTEPTCTDGGYTTHTCACGSTYKNSITAALGHNPGTPQLTNTPTCTVCGRFKVTCTRCGFLIDEYNDDGVFGEHDFSVVNFEPTCTEDGYTRYICNVCHEVQNFPGDAALGHNYQLVADSNQSSGAAMKCTRCGDSYEADYDCEVLGHETNEGEYDMPDGSTAFKCKHCGGFYN